MSRSDRAWTERCALALVAAQVAGRLSKAEVHVRLVTSSCSPQPTGSHAWLDW